MTGRTTAGDPVDASRFRFAIVVSDYHADLSKELIKGALGCFAEHGAAEPQIIRVPGAFELPVAAKLLAESGRVDAIVTLGSVIRGETAHFDFVAGEAASGIQQVMLETGIPISFGVLTTEDEKQAWARAGGDHGHKGYDAALTAIRMAAVADDIAKAL